MYLPCLHIMYSEEFTSYISFQSKILIPPQMCLFHLFLWPVYFKEEPPVLSSPTVNFLSPVWKLLQSLDHQRAV